MNSANFRGGCFSITSRGDLCLFLVRSKGAPPFLRWIVMVCDVCFFSFRDGSVVLFSSRPCGYVFFFLFGNGVTDWDGCR